jgi:gliding motility-associated-like protein
MKIGRLWFLYFMACVLLVQKVKGQNISNEGTDFWAVFPTHDPSSGSLANMNIFITAKSASEVTVSCGTYSEKKAIPANTVVVFSVPRADSYIATAEANVNLINRGIHIVASPNMPAVAAYAHVYAGARSAASLILPYGALGQKYYSMNYSQDNGGRNFLVLVAVEANTKLRLTQLDGTVKVITLANAGDVYEYLTPLGQDLTGVYVEVDAATSQCKRFAAFSGSTSLTIQCTTSRDPLFQQLYTTNSWGKIYAVAPFINRRYIVRVLAQEDNTIVNVNGSTVTLNKGRYYESSLLTEGIMITANKLISVAEYSLTQGCSSTTGGNATGDPDMVLLNPIEFNIKKITLFSSDQQAITEKYINVVIKTDSRSTFKVNGALPANGTWKTFTINPEYSYIQIKVTQQSLTLSADDGFNAIAYGFGNAESYAYSAGTSLAANQYLTLINKTTNAETSNACIGESADFKITIPYLLTRIVWKFSDGTPDYDDTAPVPTINMVNGEKLYDYEAPVNKVYSTVGQRQITATGYFPTDANSCFGSQADFEFTFNVDPLPTASFMVLTEVCPNTEVSFTDNSRSNVSDKALTKWQWDFGDGSVISTQQNPKHTYTSSGAYTVKLLVIAENGCASEVNTATINVMAKMQPSFTVNNSNCVARDIVFKDGSTIEFGRISKWIWDMGDGTPLLEKQDNQPFMHSYADVGKYTVKLKLLSDKNCYSDVVTKDIMVYHNPVADFDLPNFCLADGAAVFTNKSTITGGTGLTYSWNFGDPYANAQRPNTSTEKNPSHAYVRTGIYEVSLTVTSIIGCETVVKKQFTVNGSIPKADFTVNNESALCSNSLVEFKDLATVDFGEITKIEWYFDFLHKSTPDMVDEQPNLRSATAKVYSFKYPQFTDAEFKTYTVKMKVYSGGSCVQEKTKIITLYPIPIVDFMLSSACLMDGSGKFANLSTYVNPNANLNYLWNFGDANANLQNPNTSSTKDGQHHFSQAGKYNISLTVTLPNGCAIVKTQEVTILGSVPKADFMVQQTTALCSSNPVVFEDKSTVSFGHITRIDWYYDFLNYPNQMETDNAPQAGGIPKSYRHVYPVFSSPLSKSYLVKMVVYSGNVCIANVEKTITLKAVPDIDFAQPNEVCMDVESVKLIAREKNSMNGTGIFTGRGIKADGTFIPKNAGIGRHEIKYTYTAANGCTAEKTQTITVNETPLVDAGEDKTILDGGNAVLTASATGENLKYKWSPATGLNRDDVLNPTAMPTEDLTYTLTVTSEKGCTKIDKVFVKVLKSPSIPNSFSPNGDNINDFWNIKYLDTYPNATIEIFDRNGQRVYFSRGYKTPFDGNYKNQPLPIGAYYYVISPGNGRKILAGSLTIIR